MEAMKIGDQAECLVIESGNFKIGVTTQVGPRILGAFLGDEKNLFVLMPDEDLPNITTGFRLYGGHRLWHAPEVNPRTYAPDNDPVIVEELEDGSVSFSNDEPLTGLFKTITVAPLGGERFEVTHTLINRNQWTIELAPWALSMMAPGGFAVVPQTRLPDANPFAVDRQLNFWPYSNLTDPRFSMTEDFYILRQDTAAATPFKFGCNAPDGWIAYVNDQKVFAKQVQYQAQAVYPDFGCNIESYSCDRFLEIETLGPLAKLEPEAEVTHVERWHAFELDAPVDPADNTQLLEKIARQLAF